MSYADAYAAGVSQALAMVGTVSLLAAAVCWFAMGERAPLTSVWEHRDERTDAPPRVMGTGASAAGRRPRLDSSWDG
ncbi:MAG: hypothetical protein R3C32_07840 [Chloroflexota bacterium]